MEVEITSSVSEAALHDIGSDPSLAGVSSLEEGVDVGKVHGRFIPSFMSSLHYYLWFLVSIKHIYIFVTEVFKPLSIVLTHFSIPISMVPILFVANMMTTICCTLR